ncbi:putative patatin/cPLA2 family phospholipase [Clostridium saccharoperbutylacetonicum]|uniref:Putative esterase of the alpha-beta hydrolase superfamily n=1 Tax=Clostridium saccharoperbutylacetonicum N1-4(HMT) TaxID=931276 RepID=M1M883_9CLOT|nr:patatin family protein [Clostridium saccharoperbutylacetonicum]AGF54164.1 putative esterase of the alpha-beta hydrolase superfamily [Clostridium saccharoperbutylacetonicum N1-4(HMT)]NRT59322.1 putative patatin/cPLA2 family phospholipase [Clostridium saccharoperbutylacetonicum]NSB28513.1 putative patatin/cPLA2 family phospholipase [Clostridium saccharoperbutylacetonicum]NSB42004.1 putative patatin/cPLA2 family phospholipase [Clostridium saccharoperbutylacetonicum]
MTGLVLEGGAFRGLFTAGVLDALLDIRAELKYVIGVSAGATNAYSYVSKQRGRNLEIMERFMDNKRYISYGNLIRCKSLMDLDFVFDEIPNKHCVFDYKTFYEFNGRMLAGAFNIQTGKVEYFDKELLDKRNSILRASIAIPLVFPFEKINGNYYADGGLSDPIPIKKSIEDGNDKNIIVLTRNEGYRKTQSKTNKLTYRIYKNKYPKLANVLRDRHIKYNEQLDFCKKLEENGEAMIIRPTVDMNIDRFERDKNKLKAIYQNGYDLIVNNKEKILKYI